MKGQPETISATDNGAVIEVSRGTAGAAIINITGENQTVENLATSLPDGEFTDVVNGNTFTVTDGQLSGQLAPYTSYILYGK